MVQHLKAIAGLAGIESLPRPRHESELSWYFRTTLERVPWDNEFSDPEAEFIMGCISRAHREPNLTHLIAAHLAIAGVIGPVVTTNFDDLSLAAFWNMPAATAGAEPYVIYDPASSSAQPPRIAAGVTTILKAHGHHTTYGLGILDRNIRALSHHVKRNFTFLPAPTEGFLVVGYSGMWDDGVMALLRDPRLTKNKVVYWFYVGTPRPDSHFVRKIAERTTIRFVHISDSDLLFLKVWQKIHQDEEYYNPPLLESWHLISFPIGRSFLSWQRAAAHDWWGTKHLMPDTKEQARQYAPLVELRSKLLPLLRKLQAWDDDCMLMDCVPRSLWKTAVKLGKPVSWQEPDEMQQLSEIAPLPGPWTRRNRKILFLALSTRVDTAMPFDLLQGLSMWSKMG